MTELQLVILRLETGFVGIISEGSYKSLILAVYGLRARLFYILLLLITKALFCQTLFFQALSLIHG